MGFIEKRYEQNQILKKGFDLFFQNLRTMFLMNFDSHLTDYLNFLDKNTFNEISQAVLDILIKKKAEKQKELKEITKIKDFNVLDFYNKSNLLSYDISYREGYISDAKKHNIKTSNVSKYKKELIILKKELADLEEMKNKYDSFYNNDLKDSFAYEYEIEGHILGFKKLIDILQKFFKSSEKDIYEETK